jgi:hypothetical protein
MNAGRVRWRGASPAVLIVLTILLALAIAGCGDESPEDAGQNTPPALPSPQSMSVDLDVFDSGTAKLPAPMSAPSDSTNFQAAVLAIDSINVAVLGFAEAPIAAFTGAAGATPAQQSDGSWQWAYSLTSDTLSLNVVLNGSADAQWTYWSLRVTTTGLPTDVSDFLWFTGQASPTGDVGHWQFHDITIPATPTDLARVDWSIENADSRSLYWVNDSPGSEHRGDGVTYIQQGNAASITHLDASSLNSTDVAWDLATTAGSLTAAGYNGGAKACWQENHLNTVCPP